MADTSHYWLVGGNKTLVPQEMSFLIKRRCHVKRGSWTFDVRKVYIF